MSNTSERPFVGQTALVTGASRGIGRAISLKLAEKGANILVNYYNSSEEAEKLCQELHLLGVEAFAVQANVAEPSCVKELIQACQTHFGRIDILINNAASGVLKPTLEATLKHWRWCMEINAFSLNLLAQAAKDLMAPGSRILALTSMGSQRAIPNYGLIGASKAALESLVRSLSIELAPQGISVNTICAGAVDTDALKYFPNRESLLKRSLEQSLAGRQLTPQDVADVVYLLCLPEAQMIRGQTITVDAGYSIIG